MGDVLNDKTLFRNKFCEEATLRNLGTVPVEALQKAVQMIHVCSRFRAAATPEWQRPEQPVIVFGNPTIAGSMNQPKFGLTTHVVKIDETTRSKLFFWVTGKAHRAVQQKNRDLNLDFITSWLPWREGGHDTYRLMPIPLYEEGNFLDASAMVAGFNKDVTLGHYLSMLGVSLKFSPKVRAAFCDITKHIGLAEDCITPFAARMMKDLKE
jgi:hypothetical protein